MMTPTVFDADVMTAAAVSSRGDLGDLADLATAIRRHRLDHELGEAISVASPILGDSLAARPCPPIARSPIGWRPFSAALSLAETRSAGDELGDAADALDEIVVTEHENLA